MSQSNNNSECSDPILSMYHLSSPLNSNSPQRDLQVGSSQISRKRPWTNREDSQLCELVAQYGPKRWSLIAYLFGNRSGRQCRERWFNHLDPSVRKGTWSTKEDEIILNLVKTQGNKWSLISKHLPGRTDNAVKNRYNSTIKKRIALSEGKLLNQGNTSIVNEGNNPAQYEVNSSDTEEEEEEEEKKEEKDTDFNYDEFKPRVKRILTSEANSNTPQDFKIIPSNKELLHPLLGLSLPENDENTCSLPSIMKIFL